MKFTVRPGYVIHHTVLVKTGNGTAEQTQSFYEGDQVEFDAAAAAKHLHKLEPVGKEAAAFLADRFAPVSPAAGAAGIDPATLSSLVAQGVAAALAQRGVVPQAPASNT